VHHGAHVGFVDAHAEGDRRDDHVEVAGEERALRLVALAGEQACVVGAGREVARQALRERLALLPRRGIHDRGSALGRAQQPLGRGVARRRRRLDQLERQVRAAEAVDVPAGLGDAELLGDVLLHERRGRRGQRDHRRGPKLRQPLAQHPVLGAEVVAPVRDAVSLVDGDEHRLARGELLREAGHRPLGRPLADDPDMAGVAVDPDLLVEPGQGASRGDDLGEGPAGEAQADRRGVGRLHLRSESEFGAGGRGRVYTDRRRHRLHGELDGTVERHGAPNHLHQRYPVDGAGACQPDRDGGHGERHG
jgi:hypothetical protein